jgi:small nuclear ribonucleoprotein G
VGTPANARVGEFIAHPFALFASDLPHMPRLPEPELKKYMDKCLFLQLNANRKVVGVLRGYDAFMNVILESAEEECPSTKARTPIGTCVIRGNNIEVMEPLELIL